LRVNAWRVWPDKTRDQPPRKHDADNPAALAAAPDMTAACIAALILGGSGSVAAGVVGC